MTYFAGLYLQKSWHYKTETYFYVKKKDSRITMCNFSSYKLQRCTTRPHSLLISVREIQTCRMLGAGLYQCQMCGQSAALWRLCPPTREISYKCSQVAGCRADLAPRFTISNKTRSYSCNHSVYGCRACCGFHCLMTAGSKLWLLFMIIVVWWTNIICAYRLKPC